MRWLSVVVVVAGCVPPALEHDGGHDAAVPGAVDAGAVDSGVGDAGVVDAGVVDAGVVDAGVVDGGLDAGVFDGGRFDSGVFDAGTFVIARQVVDGGTGNPVELLTLTFPGRETTYAQWMPVRLSDGGVAPALLLTKPYDGIAWPNDPRDRRWAALGAGLHPDVDGPAAGTSPESIVYSPLTIAAQADEAAFYALHGISTLAVYGRFYAGGSIQNDVDDMITGLEFLAREPGVDRSRLGIQGGSWGGFLALYGAAFAPAAATPRVGAALYPLSDFAEEWRHVTVTMPSRLSPDAGHQLQVLRALPAPRRCDDDWRARRRRQLHALRRRRARVAAAYAVLHRARRLGRARRGRSVTAAREPTQRPHSSALAPSRRRAGFVGHHWHLARPAHGAVRRHGHLHLRLGAPAS